MPFGISSDHIRPIDGAVGLPVEADSGARCYNNGGDLGMIHPSGERSDSVRCCLAVCSNVLKMAAAGFNTSNAVGIGVLHLLVLCDRWVLVQDARRKSICLFCNSQRREKCSSTRFVNTHLYSSWAEERWRLGLHVLSPASLLPHHLSLTIATESVPTFNPQFKF
ncbi:hypothetical protein J6590_053876 [Homalodisca vitripennis]|nr:hypothetical protein J6590_053876 [Homalodisca vitripennis]